MVASLLLHMKFPTRALLRSNFVLAKGIDHGSGRIYSSSAQAFSSIPVSSDSSPTAHIKSWLLQFDGGARGNPGLGGCGVVLLKTFEEGGEVQREEVWHGFFFLGTEGVTCNYAEYQGLIYGLRTALELKVPALQVEGDSELIIRQMQGVYQCRHPKLQRLNKEAKELAEQIPYVKYRHIPRNMNSRADELSNHAMSLQLDQTQYLVDRALLMREIAAFQPPPPPPQPSDLPTILRVNVSNEDTPALDDVASTPKPKKTSSKKTSSGKPITRVKQPATRDAVKLSLSSTADPTSF